MNPRLFPSRSRLAAFTLGLLGLVLVSIGFTFDPLTTLTVIVLLCLVTGVLVWLTFEIFGDPTDSHYGA